MVSFVKKRKKNNLQEKNTKDYSLIRYLQPHGGISFSDETTVATGGGYEACLHIYEYPAGADDFWMFPLMQFDNTVSVIDISTENKDEVNKNINKSMREQNQRFNAAHNYEDSYNASMAFSELEALMQEVNGFQEVIKLVDIRIFISDVTRIGLEEKKRDIINDLENNLHYRSSVFLNEGKNEWLSIYKPYHLQQEVDCAIEGQPMTASAVAGGFPFHFSYLEDPHGSFYGTTATAGNVIFDPFAKTEKRLSYNTCIAGKMGSGKSTLLKKLFKDNAIRGNFVRAFDAAKEFVKLTKEFGGKIISADGTDGIINALQILRAEENENLNFMMHMSKMNTFYKLIKKSANEEELLQLQTSLTKLYEKYNLFPDGKKVVKITGLPPTSYPIFSDFSEFLDKEMQELFDKAKDLNPLELEVMKKEVTNISSVKNVIDNLIKTYGNIFDGYSSIAAIEDEQIVTFDIENLKKMKSEIYDSVMFLFLSLSWDNCVTNGTVMKEKYEEGQIKWDDIIRFLILIDESHHLINASKEYALDIISIYFRESRKFFGGIAMASQSLRDYVPEGTGEAAFDKIKTLFELTQYKFIMQHDNNIEDVIKKIFSNALTESQIEQIASLEKGETILSMGQDLNIYFKIYLSEEEEYIFSGGA